MDTEFVVESRYNITVLSNFVKIRENILWVFFFFVWVHKVKVFFLIDFVDIEIGMLLIKMEMGTALNKVKP